jgi:predicted aldo/keto reductase-like oxidoreductase
MQRRDFLKSAAALATLVALREEAIAAPGEVPRRTLGRTGQSVSIIGIGGYHMGAPQVSEQEGIRIVRTALDSGVNFLDNCWDYNDGESERRMGRALQDGYRQKAFLMTKIDGRTPTAAQKQLEDSLRRLKTDHIDLMQVHEVIRPGDPQQAFRPGYVVDVLKKAQQDGKIRYIGFTGHKSPEIHLSMLETADRHGFTFDTVQMPLNLMDAHYDSFTTKVLPVARKHNMGILGMKPMGGGPLLESKTATPVEFLHYAMSLPVSVTITGCDSMQVLNQALTLARNFRPLPQEQMTALLAKTVNASVAGQYEKYKTSEMFDGTSHNPQYLG